MSAFRLYRFPIPDYRFPVDISSLLQPYIDHPLSSTQLDQVSTYLDLLLRWNQKTNLTSIRNPEQILTRHFGESFFLAVKLFPSPPVAPLVITSEARDLQSAFRSPDHPITRSPDILDLGSGAGFPAIPLKILRPDVTITLVEAHHTKAVFLREVLRAVHLDAEVKNVRAESLPTGSADIVTLRAVEKFDTILPTAAGLVHSSENSPPDLQPISPTSSNPIPYPPSPIPLTRGLVLLIGSAQIARAHELLPNWHFHPEISIPRSQNRVIQLVEPN